MAKQQVKQTGDKFKTKSTIYGTLNFITEYKKLVIKCEDNERTRAIVNNLDKVEGRRPYKKSDDGFYYLTLTLSKYDKVNSNMRRYEKMLKKGVIVYATASKYDTEEYGSGVYLLVDNLRIDMSEKAESGSHTDVDEVME